MTIGISHGFFWFFIGGRIDLPTIAVGGAVDKLFVKGCEGRGNWCSEVLIVF
jgi:hypothetical protein